MREELEVLNMQPEEIKAARRKLNLSVAQAAILLGCEDQFIRRLETPMRYTMHRKISPTMERLLQAYLDGYRPRDWPQSHQLMRQ